MKLLRAIIRPHKLEDVKDALAEINIYAMTVTDVRGCGRQRGHSTRYRGAEYVANILPKVQLDLILEDDLVEKALPVIIETARTGEVGDGRIFLFECAGSYTIRTGEAGLRSARPCAVVGSSMAKTDRIIGDRRLFHCRPDFYCDLRVLQGDFSKPLDFFRLFETKLRSRS